MAHLETDALCHESGFQSGLEWTEGLLYEAVCSAACGTGFPVPSAMPIWPCWEMSNCSAALWIRGSVGLEEGQGGGREVELRSCWFLPMRRTGQATHTLMTYTRNVDFKQAVCNILPLFELCFYRQLVLLPFAIKFTFMVYCHVKDMQTHQLFSIAIQAMDNVVLWSGTEHPKELKRSLHSMTLPNLTTSPKETSSYLQGFCMAFR